MRLSLVREALPPELSNLNLKTVALVQRQVENIKSGLEESVQKAILLKTKRSENNIEVVARKGAALLARRMKSAIIAGEMEKEDEERVLEFFQDIMVRSGFSKESIREIWIQASGLPARS